MASILGKTSPLANVRREQVRANPLDAAHPANLIPPARTPQIQQTHHMNATAQQAARFFSPSERLDSDAKEFLSSCTKKPLRFDQVSPDYEGFKALAKENCWQGVVRLSGKLLSDGSSKAMGDDQRNLILGLRYEGLFRMKQYDDLASEVTNLLINQEQKQHSSSECKNITLSMRLLLNDIKLMTGRSKEAIEEVLLFRSWLEQAVIENGNDPLMIFWLWLVRGNLVNAYIRTRNWKSATLEMDKMLDGLEVYLQQPSLSEEEKSSLVMAQIILQSRIARIFFQIGSTKLGVTYYEKASSLFGSNASITRNAAIQSQLLQTQGLLLFCTNQFEQALDIFTTIVDTTTGFSDGDNSSYQGAIYDLGISLSQLEIVSVANANSKVPSVGHAVYAAISGNCSQFQADGNSSNLAAAVNNVAICALYLKQIKVAIQKIEQLVQRNPAKFLSDPIVFNLCTLYDLSFAPDMSLAKKKLLQKIASEYHVDDPILHWRSFRLN